MLTALATRTAGDDVPFAKDADTTCTEWRAGTREHVYSDLEGVGRKAMVACRTRRLWRRWASSRWRWRVLSKVYQRSVGGQLLVRFDLLQAHDSSDLRQPVLQHAVRIQWSAEHSVQGFVRRPALRTLLRQIEHGQQQVHSAQQPPLQAGHFQVQRDRALATSSSPNSVRRCFGLQSTEIRLMIRLEGVKNHSSHQKYLEQVPWRHLINPSCAQRTFLLIWQFSF